MDLPRRFIVSNRHPFSRRKEGISPDLFKDERKISYASKLEEYQALTPSAAENSAASAEPLTVSDFNSLLDMIGANLGVACLPMLDDLSTESLCTVPCLEALPPEHFLSVSATYMQPNSSPLIQNFINDFFQTLSARPQQGRP